MRPRILSDFHYSCPQIDGQCLQAANALHDELSFKLGFPSWYGGDWDALLDCLSSIGDTSGNLCSRWNWRDGKRMVLTVRKFSSDACDPAVLIKFLDVVADANHRLSSTGSANRIWIEWESSTD